MRYPAPEKLEIIRIVEQSHLPAEITLDKLGVACRTFYRWYDRYLEGGPEALADRPSSPSRVWNRIPKAIHDQIIDLALEQSELSPRELAVRFTDERRYFVSEATVYRLLKAHDLITSPAYVVVKAASEFHTKTVRPNEMWQTDFTYFKIIGWGCLGLHDAPHHAPPALPVHRARRLLALYHRMEAVQQYACRRRHRHARHGVGSVRL